jgi:hypothetical protein
MILSISFSENAQPPFGQWRAVKQQLATKRVNFIH